MTIFNLPDLGEGLEEAEIKEWYVKEGETIILHQPLVSVETAKALVDIPSPEAGVIKKLYGNPGDFIKTHSPLVEFEGEAQTTDQGSVVGRLDQSATLIDESHVKIGAGSVKSAAIKATPHVRLLAKELNIDLTKIHPTGPQGQITTDDIKKFAGQISNTQGFETIHGVRHFMAKSMERSHAEVVPATLMEDADITDLPLQTDITLALIAAILAGVTAEPALNAWFDGKQTKRVLHKELHLGLAMDSQEGLFVPVIKNISQKKPAEIRAEIDRFKQEVLDRTVNVTDLQGATMSLSNFGVFAGRYATVVVMPPMVSIIGCGKIREIAAPHQGEIKIRRIMPLSLTFDHRAVTGGEASRFLKAMIDHLAGTHD